MDNLFDQVEEKGQPPKRRGIIAIPILLILFLISLFLWMSKDTFLSVLEVDAVKVRLAQGKVKVVQKTGGTIFQAAGWIEADPYPVRVTALVSGIVKKIYIVAGQRVKKGHLLAELVDEDLLLKLRQAKTNLAQLYAHLAIRKNIVTTKVADKDKLAFELETAKAVLARLQHRAQSLGSSGRGIAKLEREQAELLVQEQKLKIREFIAQEKVIEASIQLAKAQVTEVHQQIKSQQVHIAMIELDIRRLRITAPIDGIVQNLYVREGRKQMLESDNEMSTTIAEMYNPQHLQVRVDVPLADIAKVTIGQQVSISLEASNKSLKGEVTILGGKADYQKNTLEVKVRIKEPVAILRPDMLAQVKFLEDEKTEQKTFSQSLFVKKESVYGSKKEPYVWVVSLQNRLQKRKIKQVGERDDWVAVISGVHAGERVVIGREEGLELNSKVKIRRLYE